MGAVATEARRKTNSQMARISWKRPIYASIPGPVCCLGIIIARWLFLHWGEPDLLLILINFGVAWLPFGVSILVAFVPDMRKAHPLWRTAIIAAGLVYSLLLFKQQVLQMDAYRNDQATNQRSISQALQKANEHTDVEIGHVRNDVQSVKGDVGGVRHDLQETKDSMVKGLTESTSTITTSLGKLGKPDQPEKSTMVFSLWPLENPDDPPTLVKSLSPDKDGIITVDFVFANTSNTRAENMDIWIEICKKCEFAVEPPGFDKPAGTIEQTRHRIIPGLNPGTTFEKSEIKIKPQTTFGWRALGTYFEIGFRYSCQTCGKPQRTQVVKIVPIGN
jgi:hypothetical protein